MHALMAQIVLAAEEVKIHPVVDGGFLAEWAWLIPVVPLVAAGLIFLIGTRLRYKGYELAVGSMAFVALYGVALFVSNALVDPIFFEDQVEVARIGSLAIEWGWLVDGLSIMMYFVVGVVGLFVFTYSFGYMKGEIRYTFFFGAFTLFAGAMLLLVAAPNMLQLIVGWEGVGLASYLLIGHYWEEKSNSDAGMKAFLVNKTADVGLFVGIIILTITAGSFRYREVFDAVFAGDITETVAVAAGVLLFIGAMGKSGQFPFHVWLPDAMAGPTPVSSLMHAATMVTAGVFLMARMFPFYEELARDVRPLILTVGVLTLFLTGLIALVQDDIKKVLAYSTLSQLGYMMAAIGAGAYTAAVFHLFTHAFFKGLLFLGAGSVIHAVHSNNMSDMGGLRKYMPSTYWTFVIGSLALAGIIPLAGFFSKDEILAALSEEGYIGALVVALAGALVTAFYMTRAVFLTFHGSYKGHGTPHESPRVMTYPLIGLAGFSAVAGFANVPGLYEGFTEWLAARPAELQELLGFHAESFDPVLALLGLTAAGLGIAGGYYLFYADKDTQAERDRFTIPVLYPLLANKYYIDDAYHYGVVNPIKGPIAGFVDWFNGSVIDGVVNGAGFLSRGVGRLVYEGIDQRGIDLAINAAAVGTGDAGEQVRHLQSGKIRQYAGALFAGSVLLVVGFIIFG